MLVQSYVSLPGYGLGGAFEETSGDGEIMDCEHPGYHKKMGSRRWPGGGFPDGHAV